MFSLFCYKKAFRQVGCVLPASQLCPRYQYQSQVTVYQVPWGDEYPPTILDIPTPRRDLVPEIPTPGKDIGP